MLKIYLQSTLRNVQKHKLLSMINLVGLSIGMICSLYLYDYTLYEKSFDQFNPKSDRIARVRLDILQPETAPWQSPLGYPALGPRLKDDFAEVENFCRLSPASVLLHNELNDYKFSETQGYFADTTSFDFFSIDLTKGDAKSALSGTNKIVLSESMAKRYFGESEPVGKTLIARDPSMAQSYEVTGIFKDYPSNSHIDFKYLISMPTLFNYFKIRGDTLGRTEMNWSWVNFYSYLLVKDEHSVDLLNSKLPGFIDRYSNDNPGTVKKEISLLPLKDIYLKSHFFREAKDNGNEQLIVSLSVIGILILIIAWINYVTLSTANAIDRARETGVRKALGASKMDTMLQFFFESACLNAVAFLIAIAVLKTGGRFINVFFDRAEAAEFSLPGSGWLMVACTFLIGIALSGIYPAMIISSFQPAEVLKGVVKNSDRGLMLRKVLMAMQFGVAMIMIAMTLVIFLQLRHMLTKDIGVSLDQTLVLHGPEADQRESYQASFVPFKNELLSYSGVKGFSAANNIMGRDFYWAVYASHKGLDSHRPLLYRIDIDENYIPMFGMKLLAGRNFSNDMDVEQKSLIINESALSSLKFNTPEEAIDATIIFGSDTTRIAGVIMNYHHLGLQEKIEPLALLYQPEVRRYYSIKYSAVDHNQLLAQVETAWNKTFRNDPFRFFFLDEYFDRQYQTEKNFGKVISTFSAFAILVAMLGLLGLTAHLIIVRKKEIAIRKVMGAPFLNLLYVLSKDFLTGISISLIIAVPVGAYFIGNWLDNFAYRIDSYGWVFLVSGCTILLIAGCTVGAYSKKAWNQNSIESLRAE